MAYHVLSRALEARTRPRQRPEHAFAAAVRHALDGSVDSARHRAAGRAARAAGLSENHIGEAAQEQLAADLNPLGRALARARTREGALLVHRAFNEAADLDVRTALALGGGGALLVESRVAARPGEEDPTACRDAHLASMQFVMDNIVARASSGGAPCIEPAASVSSLARALGLGSTAAFDAALAFESAPGAGVAQLAALLGCRQRTLQRQLAPSGLSAGALRRACMLARATDLLGGPMGLADAAQLAGYADHAHMTRAFVAACGLPPSVLRMALAGPLPARR